jgi:hypothetical protein
MQALLDVVSDRTSSAAAEYAAAALSGLPAVRLPSADQQPRLSPPTADTGYLSKEEVDNVLKNANCVQSGEQRAEAAAAADGSKVLYDLRGVGRVRVTDMQLHGAGTPSVCAHVRYVCDDGVACEAPLRASEHGPPPDFKMQCKPSIVDTIKLFTLSKEHAFAFVQLADALLLEREGIRMPDPLRMVLTGEPGTGKSQVLKALSGLHCSGTHRTCCWWRRSRGALHSWCLRRSTLRAARRPRLLSTP